MFFPKLFHILLCFHYQVTFNSQFTQRYRNNRRSSRQATTPKMSATFIQATLTGVTGEPQHDEAEEGNYEEKLSDLKKLMARKSGSSATVIKEILHDTHVQRRQWLKKDISIDEILKEYCCFSQSKWVSLKMKVIFQYLLCNNISHILK